MFTCMNADGKFVMLCINKSIALVKSLNGLPIKSIVYIYLETYRVRLNYASLYM